MLNIQLDNATKVKLGFFALVILGISFFIYRNWAYWSGNEVDLTITSFVETRAGGPIDPTLPRGPRNPEDPKKRQVITVFANHDGKLRLIEFPNDPDRRMEIRFEPDVRRKEYVRWKDRWSQLEDIQDPVKRMIAYNGFSVIDPRRGSSGVLVYAGGLTVDQRRQERTLGKALRDDIDIIESEINTGTFKPLLYDKIVAALDTYRANDANPAEDKTKARLAYDVFNHAMDYIEQREQAKIEKINAYVEGVYNLLNDDQRQKMQEASTRFATRMRGASAMRPTGTNEG